jgi:hypothetical protein
MVKLFCSPHKLIGKILEGGKTAFNSFQGIVYHQEIVEKPEIDHQLLAKD